jgi:hypothetical protein
MTANCESTSRSTLRSTSAKRSAIQLLVLVLGFVLLSLSGNFALADTCEQGTMRLADGTCGDPAPAARPENPGQQPAAPQQGAQQQAQQGDQVDFSDCEDSKDTAQKSCTTQDMTAGMNPAQMQQAQQMQQQAQQANQNVAGAGNNSGQQCKNQADLSKLLAGMSALKGGACSATVSDCKDTCKKYIEQNNGKSGKEKKNVDKAKRYAKLCEAFAPNSTAAFAQAAAMLAGMFMNQQCAEQSATASPTPSPIADCTNPTYAKTNIMCICQNDPKSAMCQQGQQFPGGLQTSNGNNGPGTPAFGANGSDSPSDGAALLGDGGKAKGASGSATTGEGGGGGGLQGGRGGGAAGGGDGGGGYGPSGINTGVITGTASGGGSGGGAGPGGGGGGAGGGGGGGRNRKTAGDFDLSQFLPRGKTKNYGGQSVSAKDGITGPMGPSIWEKVSNQYQLQKPNLVQDK